MCSVHTAMGEKIHARTYVRTHARTHTHTQTHLSGRICLQRIDEEDRCAVPGGRARDPVPRHVSLISEGDRNKGSKGGSKTNIESWYSCASSARVAVFAGAETSGVYLLRCGDG